MFFIVYFKCFCSGFIALDICTQVCGEGQPRSVAVYIAVSNESKQSETVYAKGRQDDLRH